MTNVIQIQTEWNDIYEFSRDNIKNKIVNKINFQNYFYIRKCDYDDVVAVLGETTTKNNQSVDYDIIDDSKFSIYNEEVLKVCPNNYHFWACRTALKDAKIKTYEAYMDIILKYITENKTQFSDKRNVGLIDIETDMSLDVENAPAHITSITLYNYTDNLYHTWVLKNASKDEVTYKQDNLKLYVYDDEKEMLYDFADKFKLFDYDICGGWNSNNYDFAYIINRFKTLKMQPELLSKFGKISIRSYYKKGQTYWYPEIMGVELIDFIPVLQKNTCYSPQPASFSLESCSNFYLDNNEKLVDIGAEAWKTDINNFIKYNLKDVELVKELVDKFALVDFLIVIQNDLAGVPLNSATHNSIVLLYYLKTHYPNVILPDNPGFIYLEDDLINLNQTYLKIKAAHVIKPTSGIHHNVSIFDFAGLYPSIFRTFNICPSTLNDKEGLEIDDIVMWNMVSDNVVDSKVIKEYNLKAKYNQKVKGIYPQILEELTAKRKIHKYKLPELAEKYGKKDRRYLLALYRSDVLKQVSNSLFGVGAYNKFCIFNPKVSAAVTSISRKAIQLVEEWCKSYNYEVITGDSVTENTTLFIKHNNNNYFYTIKELITKFKNHKTDRKDKDEYIFDEDVFTWSYNFKTKMSEYKKITKLIVHNIGLKNVYNVSSKYYSFNVTEDHGFYNKNDELMSAKEYKKKEKFYNVINPPKLIKLDNISFTNKINKINLVEISKEPLNYYLNKKNKNYGINMSKDYFELFNIYLHGPKRGQRYNIKKFPKYIELNSEFGFVLGAYIAEGSVCRNGTSGFRIAAGNTKYITEVYNILKNLFGDIIGLKDGDTRIVGGNYILSNLFKELGGHTCKNKKLPDFILDTNEDFFLGFLRGYTLGDGFHEHRFKTDKEHLKSGGVGSKSKKLVSQIYFIMKNIYNYDNNILRIRYRKDKDFYSCAWNTDIKNVSSCILQTKNLLTNYNVVYDIEVEDNHNFIDIQGGIILHNTDSVMVKHPLDVDAKELGNILNKQLKDWVFKQYPNINKDNYCMELEYEKTFKIFVMKDAKKKYYGILNDGSFYCKGFDIIQHSLSKKIKELIKEFYILLMRNPGDVTLAKEKIKEIKKQFYSLDYNDLGVELKIAKNLDDYDTNVPHIRAARYSNQYLGTNFEADSAGKMLYIIPKYDNKYPSTDVVFLDENTKLPDSLQIDYDKHWQKFFLDKIKLLEDIEIMKIDRILSPNLSLDMF